MDGCSTIKDPNCFTKPCLPFELDLVPVPRQLYANRLENGIKIVTRGVLLDQLKIGRRSRQSVFGGRSGKLAEHFVDRKHRGAIVGP